ncbi:MAG TPA: family 78 glycoside hydrolase catalytic domain [Opitutaceae bacterium]|nr:family 78 glycoside hydrolase catalytic domain [Opitutaceae bacterium]
MRLLPLLACGAALLPRLVAAADMPAVSHLTCDGLAEATVIDTTAPRFSWRLESSARGARQTAYQLRIAAIGPDGKPTAESVQLPRVGSDQSQMVTVPGFTPKPRQRYRWQVRIWDEQDRDSGWSEAAQFDTGLLGGGWPATAAWLGDGVATAQGGAPRARYFRGEFDVASKPARARLYLSAFGAVEPWLNGRKVGNDFFLPGWPDYRKRVFYVAYDVTDGIQAGHNALGLILGEGWYSSTLLRGSQFGHEPMAAAFLELTDATGATTMVTTDKNWRWAEGPITAQSIYYGETFDARRDNPQWSTPQGAAWDWHPVQAQGMSSAVTAITAHFAPPIRRTEELHPISRREVSPGVFLYDLGQNMVGWARLRAQAPAGTQITLRFAEMLEADGTIHTRNLRTAHATATYIARGDGVEVWEPRFSFFGFRYIEVSGLAQPPDDVVTGIVLHSDIPRIGYFECSNPLLNKLYSNTLWGQKGNFLEVPTDCPQRDERLGWTGDAQVFSNTANYNFGSGAFYRQWLTSLRDSYRDDPGGLSGFADVAPDIGLRYGSTGWGDAAVIVPYNTWVHTGDRRLLEENFDAIQHWIDAQARDWPDGIRRSTRSYGDWLAPGFKPAEAPTPYTLIATAYYAHVADLAARIAAELGRTEAAERDRALFAHVRDAFAREYIATDGRLASDEQTAYLLALGFDLVPPAVRPQTIAHLVRTFAEKNDHLATGFLGTPLVAPVLTAVGRPDLAYKVVQQETYPGWLFSVKNGATTVWERWDSWTPEHGFNPEGMNSFNHYAYGCVVGWFYDTIAGLKPDAAAPGWKRFQVAPIPGGGLTSAKASVETPYGVAASDWRIANGRFELAVTVPANTTAQVSLPASRAGDVTEAGRPLRELTGATNLGEASGRVVLTVPAGRYAFAMPAPR